MNLAELQALLHRLATEARPFAAHGRVADYIPALASVDPSRFGIALATVDGDILGAGDFETRFSIQSVSKVFSLGAGPRSGRRDALAAGRPRALRQPRSTRSYSWSTSAAFRETRSSTRARSSWSTACFRTWATR